MRSPHTAPNRPSQPHDRDATPHTGGASAAEDPALRRAPGLGCEGLEGEGLESAGDDLEDGVATYAGLDPELREQLVTFETFFKTFGFKRIHGRVWGLLVLAGHPLSSKEVVAELGISQGAASTTINELQEWGAVRSTFDATRRCHLHEAVGSTLSIVATVLRRREQVAFEQFRAGASRALDFVLERYGPRDPRALTLRSIIATCDLADAMMNVIFSSVSSALGDPQSLLSRAVNAAMKVGVGRLAKTQGKLENGGRFDQAEERDLG